MIEAFPLFSSLADHTLNKLSEIRVVEDLDNTANIEGVTPLDGVLDSMQSTHEFMLSTMSKRTSHNRH